MKINITTASGKMIFSHECDGNTMRNTAELAIRAGVILNGAFFCSANLAGADLRGGSFAGADFTGAILQGASLGGTDFTGARMGGAKLDGALLNDCILEGAAIEGDVRLVGRRPVFQIGPVGERGMYLVAYWTDRGIRIQHANFYGCQSAFRNAVVHEYGDSPDTGEYMNALEAVRRHFAPNAAAAAWAA